MRRWHGHLRLLLSFVVFASLLFGAVAEATFWLEFSTRFNFIAVDYLIYTKEVIGNIRQSYPVGWILAGIAVLAASAVFLLRHRIVAADLSARSWTARGALLTAAILLPVASYSLANVDQMAGEGNAYAEELSGNGLFTLAAALRRNELDYDRFYLTLPTDEAQRVLRGLDVEWMDRATALTHKETLPDFMHRKASNVVLITVESLSAEFLGVYGSDKALTPNLDRLASQGLMFANVLATGTRTVRGLEALSLGTPPVPGQAIVRRPNNSHLTTIGELLEHQGFQPAFIYGGYGYFDNMNDYFSANDYAVVDRTDFPADSIPFENVWGVADEALFANAAQVIDGLHAKGKPFFAHIMTTSNHRPFTYPDGRIDIPSPGGREGAVKYTDFAIGQFISQAAGKAWYNDTLFVIVADHCASVAGKVELPVDKYRIPLIFYAPSLVKTGRVERMISQIDIVPTLFEAMGMPGDEHYFGTSVHEQKGEARAFISNYQSLGYLKNGRLTVLKPQRRVESFVVDPVTFETRPAPVDLTLRNEAIAYYQTASRAFKGGELNAPGY
jgi:phosphoglycerol transferase MdoB-like AlkP superfamily enzyme